MWFSSCCIANHKAAEKQTLGKGFPTGCPFQLVLVVKNPPVNAGDIRDTGSIPGYGRSPGGGQGNPLQNSFLGNPMDRGAYSPLGSSGELQSIGSQRVGHD